MPENANDILAELDELVVRHDGGSSVKIADVKRITDKYRKAKAEEATKPQPKTMNDARVRAREYLREVHADKPKDPNRAEPVKA